MAGESLGLSFDELQWLNSQKIINWEQAEKDYFLALAQGMGLKDWPGEKQGVEGLEAAEAHVQSTTMGLLAWRKLFFS